MGGFEYTSPSQIRFTQDSIHNRFQDGGSVNQLIENIERGFVQVNEIPPIRVCKQNNKYYSIDNRRLYVFRVLQKRNILHTIKVKIVPYIKEDKFTTENDGASIRVRRDTTYPHTIETQVKQKPRNQSPAVAKPTTTLPKPAATPVVNKIKHIPQVEFDFNERSIPRIQQPQRLALRSSSYLPQPSPPKLSTNVRQEQIRRPATSDPLLGIDNPLIGYLEPSIPKVKTTQSVYAINEQPTALKQPTKPRNDIGRVEENLPDMDDEEECCCPEWCSCCCCCGRNCKVM